MSESMDKMSIKGNWNICPVRLQMAGAVVQNPV